MNCFSPVVRIDNRRSRVFWKERITYNARISTCDFLDHVRRQGEFLAIRHRGQRIVHLFDRWPLEAQHHLHRFSHFLLVLLLPSSNSLFTSGRFVRHGRDDVPPRSIEKRLSRIFFLLARSCHLHKIQEKDISRYVGAVGIIGLCDASGV